MGRPSRSETMDAAEAAAADCRIGRHVASARTTLDARGIEIGRCRHCGCRLKRMPTIGRWYESGVLG